MGDKRILEDEAASLQVYIDDIRRFGRVEEAIRPYNLISWNVDLNKADRILEIACGPGYLSFLLASQHPTAQVLGTDISAELIEIARQKNGAVPNLRYAVRDGYALDDDDDVYDLVICHASLHHFARPAAVVKEMLRVTKPEGKVYVFDLTRDMPEEFLKQLRDWEATGELTHRLLSASIEAALDRDEYRELISGLDLVAYDMFFFTNPGPGNLPLPVVGLIISKREAERGG